MPFPNDMSHEDYHDEMRQAQARQQALIREDNLQGTERAFSCLLSPGDGLVVKRVGIPGGKSTYLAVGMSTHGEAEMVALSIADARRFAAAILDCVDEADPVSTKVSDKAFLKNAGIR